MRLQASNVCPTCDISGSRQPATKKNRQRIPEQKKTHGEKGIASVNGTVGQQPLRLYMTIFKEIKSNPMES